MDYNLKRGWVSADEGRDVFRSCVKGLAAMPVGMAESVYKGLPYLYRKMRGLPEDKTVTEFRQQMVFEEDGDDHLEDVAVEVTETREKVYKHSAGLTDNIRKKLGQVIRNLGYRKGYDEQLAVDENDPELGYEDEIFDLSSSEKAGGDLREAAEPDAL